MVLIIVQAPAVKKEGALGSVTSNVTRFENYEQLLDL